MPSKLHFAENQIDIISTYPSPIQYNQERGVLPSSAIYMIRKKISTRMIHNERNIL